MAIPEASIRAAYAKHLLHEHLLAKLNDASSEQHRTLPTPPEVPNKVGDEGPYQGQICIIGAGVTGLCAAMILKSLKITNIDILEATDRVGGRCYTQPLSDDPKYHNYYDVGAMRIPEIPWMQQVLDFIDYLGLSESRKPYVYRNTATPSSYWYKHDPITDDKFDNFMTSIVNDFTTNFDNAFAKWLTSDKDNYSTRGFLMEGPQNDGAPNPHWTYDDTVTAELYDTSTGLFDQSFTETVIDYADFQAAASGKWWRVDGGMQKVTDAMHSHLTSTSWPSPDSTPIKVKTKSPVVALSKSTTTNKITVTVAGKQPVEYDMVFNTTAMAPLQQMDLQGLDLPKNILTSIRSLGYDRATKVAVKFSKPWWHRSSNPNDIYGGISSSDLPIRNVVYPSWNDGPDNPAVLMVSYSWALDATRMASLTPNYTVVKPSKDDPIVTRCLRDLVKLWSGEPNPPTFEDLSSMYETHHAWAWEHDPWTGGAFALFGPGQFKNVYPEFYPLFCGDKFAICGEALSAHHAWITGAMDSAYVKVTQFLCANGRTEDLKKLKASTFDGGKGKHAEEMDEKLVKYSVLLGDGGGPKGWGDQLKLGRREIE
ncbi:MAG: hypothetical protein Q9160_008738 [Pyrenula sp. 1 TL-2023]